MIKPLYSNMEVSDFIKSNIISVILYPSKKVKYKNKKGLQRELFY